MYIFTPPHSPGIGVPWFARHIFLAGSIEMGKAENWQQEFIDYLSHHKDSDNLVIFNPRRTDWDPTWEQSKDNPMFVEQVEWELAKLERSDLVIFYFQPGTMSPISLMELGLMIGQSANILVCCPDGYARKGNVEITCNKYGILLFHDKESLKRHLSIEITNMFS